MKSAPYPENEARRLVRLNLYRILDTPPEAAFDRITRIVAETIDVPIALVSLIDSERQWFKSKHDLDADETPREIAFCAHAILGDGLFVVEDATKDARFADNPLAASDPNVRFYAGAPLTTHDGLNLGTLCAIDRRPRTLTDKQLQLLSDLSAVVVDELELRIALRSAMNNVVEELKRNTMMDEFISSVSHELRTPLTSIRGSLGLLEAGAVSGIPAEAINLIDIAHRNANNLLLLVNDLLDFQKIESSDMDIDFGVVDCGSLFRKTCENMEGFAKESNVNLRVEIGYEGTIVGDGDRLAQVLTNLLSNAIKFSTESDEVVVRSQLGEDRFCFSVTDNGPGISENFRDQIFKDSPKPRARVRRKARA